MRFALVFAATVLASIASAQGFINVANNTPNTIYYICSQGEFDTTICSGSVNGQSSASIPYPGDGLNVSVKMTPNPGDNDPFQFELATTGSSTSYNLSFLNGDPYLGYVRSVIPSDSTCGTIYCGPNDESCGYQTSNPNPSPAPISYCNTGATLTVNIG